MSENKSACEGCKSGCGHSKVAGIQKLEPNSSSRIENIIGIVSGKGGVGKSFVTSILATAMVKKGYYSAVLDADITGPSIPKAFGIDEMVMGNGKEIYPAISNLGIEIMSINLILEKSTDPVIWRGPIVGNIVGQFFTDVVWNHVDYMFIDMPPGTGDVPLTVFQSIPLSGIIIVTSPQELVSMIVEKAYNMAKMMNIPIIGLIENMSYFVCPDNGKKYNVFGESHIDRLAEKMGIPVLAKLPIDPKISSLADSGCIEQYDISRLEKAVEALENLN
ncbi:MAG: Mrp/NBP35 family ATP-binding protein [Tissierellia bacterium]|nr:Mrp/NBP35 family ATP-binding protein [Tissierellia bacterium]